MKIRLFKAEAEYPKLCDWWKAHKALPVPIAFLPSGFMATDGESDVACAFLYLESEGRIAMIEYITTNPELSFTRITVEAVKALLVHAESCANNCGCRSIISMTKPGSSEERLMASAGYSTSEGVGHRMFGKILPCL